MGYLIAGKRQTSSLQDKISKSKPQGAFVEKGWDRLLF